MPRLPYRLRGRPLRAADTFSVHIVHPDQRGGTDLLKLATARGLAPERIFAVLQTSNADTRVAVLTRDEALLLYALQEPTWDPDLFARLLGPEHESSMVDLLVLGAIVGTAPEQLQMPASTARSSHPLDLLSMDAIEYAAAHRSLNVDGLAQRLYQYNSLCAPSVYRTRFSDRSDYLSWLAGEADEAKLVASKISFADPIWIRMRSGRSEEARFKLYLSPIPDDLPLAFQLLSSVLCRARDWDAKVVGSPSCLGRPDKLLAYFTSLESLRSAMDSIAPQASCLRPQGVPFTARGAASTILSWGIDPPARHDGSRSWRQHLAFVLASAVSRWRVQENAPEIQAFISATLRDAGIDPNTWISAEAHQDFDA